MQEAQKDGQILRPTGQSRGPSSRNCQGKGLEAAGAEALGGSRTGKHGGRRSSHAGGKLAGTFPRVRSVPGAPEGELTWK